MANKPFLTSSWEVKGIRDAEKFFSTLLEALPLPAHLCFEGSSFSSDVRKLLATHAVEPTMQIRAGTIWPKPTVFHVIATEQFLRELAALATKHANPEICDHFYAYNDGHGLMHWHDAFDDPLLIDESIAEAALQRFCQKLGVQYLRWRAAQESR